jgi:hypothetical protein
LSLDDHHDRNRAAFKEVLEDEATVTKPVTQQNLIGGVPRKASRPRLKEMQ